MGFYDSWACTMYKMEWMKKATDRGMQDHITPSRREQRPKRLGNEGLHPLLYWVPKKRK